MKMSRTRVDRSIDAFHIRLANLKQVLCALEEIVRDLEREKSESGSLLSDQSEQLDASAEEIENDFKETRTDCEAVSEKDGDKLQQKIVDCQEREREQCTAIYDCSGIQCASQQMLDSRKYVNADDRHKGQGLSMPTCIPPQPISQKSQRTHHCVSAEEKITLSSPPTTVSNPIPRNNDNALLVPKCSPTEDTTASSAQHATSAKKRRSKRQPSEGTTQADASANQTQQMQNIAVAPPHTPEPQASTPPIPSAIAAPPQRQIQQRDSIPAPPKPQPPNHPTAALAKPPAPPPVTILSVSPAPVDRKPVVPSKSMSISTGGPPPPPPPPPKALVVRVASAGPPPPAPGTEVPAEDEDLGGPDGVERKLDALYKIMTRTLSLVQAGGGGGGGGGGEGCSSMPATEWKGRTAKPAAPPDSKVQAVHDQRELMLMELRKKVAGRRKKLDDEAE